MSAVWTPSAVAADPGAQPAELRAGRPLHILHVVAPAAYGGLERVVHALVCGHAALGHRVTVAAVVDPAEGDAHPFFGPILEGGGTLEILRVRGRDYAGEWAAVRSLIQRLRPDIVHTHGYRPDVLAGSAARRLQVPLISTVHGFTGGDWKNRVYEWLQRRAFRRFDGVVAVSRPMTTQLARAGVPAERLHVIPNAWAPGEPALERAAARTSLGIAEGEWTIGFVGRLSREKGADVLVDALTHLRDLPVQLSVLGDGADAPVLRQRAQELSVAERVRWHGAVPAAHRLFRAFDVFVLSSRTEGTPIALFEAMAAGVPVVATAVGGVPDVVSPAEALLVPSDDPAALSGALRACHGDVMASAERARSAAERLARERAVGPWLSRYEEVYRLTLRPKGRIAPR
jgi:glycosyltransferase involved in cell wall biosynthesis